MEITDRSADSSTSTPRRGLQASRAAAVIATLLGIVCLITGLATTVARSLPAVPVLAGDTWAMITTFTDFGALAYGLALTALLLALIMQFRLSVAIVGVVTSALLILHLSWVVPAYVPDRDRVASASRLRVLAENLLFGGADPAGVVAAAGSADVLVATEITESAARALQARGIARHLGHESGGPVPRNGAHGTRVYSRFPIVSSRPVDPSAGATNWAVDIGVPDLGVITVVAAHPPRPDLGGSKWLKEQERLRVNVPSRRTIVAGDLNAVDSHPSLRRFRADGFRGADEIVGAGWQPTFPARSHMPPLIAIDHILLSSDLTATEFRTVAIPRSDHRGVFATVTLRG